MKTRYGLNLLALFGTISFSPCIIFVCTVSNSLSAETKSQASTPGKAIVNQTENKKAMPIVKPQLSQPKQKSTQTTQQPTPPKQQAPQETKQNAQIKPKNDTKAITNSPVWDILSKDTSRTNLKPAIAKGIGDDPRNVPPDKYGAK